MVVSDIKSYSESAASKKTSGVSESDDRPKSVSGNNNSNCPSSTTGTTTVQSTTSNNSKATTGQTNHQHVCTKDHPRFSSSSSSNRSSSSSSSSPIIVTAAASTILMGPTIRPNHPNDGLGRSKSGKSRNTAVAAANKDNHHDQQRQRRSPGETHHSNDGNRAGLGSERVGAKSGDLFLDNEHHRNRKDIGRKSAVGTVTTASGSSSSKNSTIMMMMKESHLMQPVNFGTFAVNNGWGIGESDDEDDDSFASSLDDQLEKLAEQIEQNGVLDLDPSTQPKDSIVAGKDSDDIDKCPKREENVGQSTNQNLKPSPEFTSYAAALRKTPSPVKRITISTNADRQSLVSKNGAGGNTSSNENQGGQSAVLPSRKSPVDYKFHRDGKSGRIKSNEDADESQMFKPSWAKGLPKKALLERPPPPFLKPVSAGGEGDDAEAENCNIYPPPSSVRSSFSSQQQQSSQIHPNHHQSRPNPPIDFSVTYHSHHYNNHIYPASSSYYFRRSPSKQYLNPAGGMPPLGAGNESGFSSRFDSLLSSTSRRNPQSFSITNDSSSSGGRFYNNHNYQNNPFDAEQGNQFERYLMLGRPRGPDGDVVPFNQHHHQQHYSQRSQPGPAERFSQSLPQFRSPFRNGAGEFGGLPCARRLGGEPSSSNPFSSSHTSKPLVPIQIKRDVELTEEDHERNNQRFMTIFKSILHNHQQRRTISPPSSTSSNYVHVTPNKTTKACSDTQQSDQNFQEPLSGGEYHYLQRHWVWWFLHGKSDVTGKSWESSLKKIAEFCTIEHFCNYNHILPSGELEAGMDYYIFKDGIKPMWEDPSNIGGGRWLAKSKSSLEVLWLETILCVIGEQFGEANGGCIRGIVSNSRVKISKIALWLGESSEEEVMDIGHVLADKLIENVPVNLRPDRLEYQLHADVAYKGNCRKHSYIIPLTTPKSNAP